MTCYKFLAKQNHSFVDHRHSSSFPCTTHRLASLSSSSPLPPTQLLLLVSRIPDNRQNVHENVDNVHVQVQRSKDILLWRYGVLVLATHHHLRVVDQVEAEQQSTQGRIDQLHRLAAEKYAQDSEQHEDDHGYQQHSAHHREVPFSLEREQSEGEANDCRDSNSHQDFVGPIATGHQAEHKRHGQSEYAQKYVVCWCLSSHSLAAGHGYHSDEHNDERDPPQPRIRL